MGLRSSLRTDRKSNRNNTQRPQLPTRYRPKATAKNHRVKSRSEKPSHALFDPLNNTGIKSLDEEVSNEKQFPFPLTPCAIGRCNSAQFIAVIQD
jgi:hypothetical protein